MVAAARAGNAAARVVEGAREMADSDDDMVDDEDMSFFRRHAHAASFLKRDQGVAPDGKTSRQKAREKDSALAARRKERAELDRLQGRVGGGRSLDDCGFAGDGVGSDDDLHARAAARKKRKAPAAGHGGRDEREGGGDSEGEVDEGPRRNRHWQDEEENERKQALPVKLADGSIKKVMREHALPDPDTIEEQPALSKRAQKRARGERIAEKKALERGEVYVSASAKKKEEAERAQQEEEDRAREESAQAKNKKGKGGKAEAQEDRPLTHEEKKMAIADTCSQLMHDPEKNIAALGSLHRFCLDTDQVIVKMALLSEAMVFADILPDYRIRLPTEKEREMKVSKEVAQQRAYESALLAAFQRFLQFMEAAGRKAEEEARLLWEGGAHAAVQGCMLAVVIQAMSLLQKRRPAFNFASNILQSLARRADSPVPAIADMALAGLTETIAGSPMNEHVKGCIALLADVVRSRGSRVNPQVLRVFLALRITSDMLSAPAKARKGKGKKEAEGSDEEEQRDLEASMLEGTASLDKGVVRRLTTAVLDAVLTSYFRVLKLDPPVSELLPPVLEGLSRFAHLVNIDFFSDLLQAIKGLLGAQSETDAGRLSVASSLHCVTCVFRCLKNQGEVWDMDLQDFYDVLFQCVWRIGAAPEEVQHVPLLLDALRLALYDMRQLSSDRVAGFCKRLLALTLSLPPQHAMAVLSLVRMLFTRYPKTRRLVEMDHACVGVYNPELGNAELSNALASTAYEVSLLRRSLQPLLPGERPLMQYSCCCCL